MNKLVFIILFILTEALNTKLFQAPWEEFISSP